MVTLVAALACALLIAVALARALALSTDYYDAYECRLAGRALAGVAPWASVPVYRSPLFLAVCGLGEALGPRAGWLAPSLLSCAGYVALLVGCWLVARRLGAPPWAAALVALLAGLDRLAFLYAPHGLPDVAAAGACALVLALAAAPAEEGPWPARPLLLGGAIGLAALCRQNAGLIGLGLAWAAFPIPRPRDATTLAPRPSLPRLALAGAVALALYLALTTCVFAWARGSLAGGLAVHGEWLATQSAQAAENRLRYGTHPDCDWSLPWRAAGVASPALAPLGLVGCALALRDRRSAARALAAWLGVHLLFLELFLGHGEARYGLPALPALAGLGSLTLGAAAARLPPAFPAVAALSLTALTLGLGAPYELRRLRDPAQRASFPARIAATVEGLLRPGGGLLYTTTHPYGVFPRVLVEPGTPYPGDPVHGILHLGPVPLRYHLGRDVTQAPSDDPDLGPAGLRDPAALRAFVRKQPGFRAGDVLLVGEPRPCLTWTLREAPPGPFGVARVVDGPDGLDLEWRWLEPGREP